MCRCLSTSCLSSTNETRHETIVRIFFFRMNGYMETRRLDVNLILKGRSDNECMFISCNLPAVRLKSRVSFLVQTFHA